MKQISSLSATLAFAAEPSAQTELVAGISVSGTLADECAPGVLRWATPTDQPDCGREDLKHTRLSSWINHVLRRAAVGLTTPDPTRVGLVSASRFGCVAATDDTRKGLRQAGILGIDPIRFAKATHVYPLAANALERGWRGPITAFVGHDSAAWHALLFAADQIGQDVADVMFVVGYEELDEVLQLQLRQSGYLELQQQSGRTVAENVSVVVLARAGIFKHRRRRIVFATAAADRECDEVTVTRPPPAGTADPAVSPCDVLGATLIRDLVHWSSRDVGAGGIRIDGERGNWQLRLTPFPARGRA